jgi:acyl-CoA synthetase (AMP-forming)/AMP-acid ligase II
MYAVFAGAIGIRPGDRSMNMMPTYHTTGISAEFMAPLTVGASVAFVDLDPGRLIAHVDEFRPTWFNLVPSMHQSVLDSLGDRVGVFSGSSLRFTRSSSARMPVGMKSNLERLYGVPMVDVYGATETGTIALTGMPGSGSRPGSVGRPVHAGIGIMDVDGNALVPGERGEICVTGPTVISGYENNPQANAELFRDGWYRTGDEGYLDDDGFLYVTGRLREVVNRGGEKFSLAEIDEALHRIAGIATGSAFAAPHPRLGQEVYAAVVLSAGTDKTPDALRAELATRLSWARAPKRVFIVPELPMNSTGKVLRNRLQALLT